MVADLAHGTVVPEVVPRGIGVEVRGLSGMRTRYLFVAGGIGDVRMVIFVGSHGGRPAEVSGSKNGVMTRVCRMRMVEVVGIADASEGNMAAPGDLDPVRTDGVVNGKEKVEGRQ